MYKGKTFLAIIPARGGSKRLPNKNILNLSGKPLIAWTIKAAQKSKYLDRIVVNSDSKKILEIAKNYGVEIFERPKELGEDNTNTIDVILHQLKFGDFSKYDYVVLLQPTSPLRNERHIDEAIEKLLIKQADAVISFSKPLNHCEWVLEIKSHEDIAVMLRMYEQVLNKRSQDLNNKFLVNGAIYICAIEKFLKERTFFLSKNVYPYIMDKKIFSIDIDDEFDFKLIELFIEWGIV